MADIRRPHAAIPYAGVSAGGELLSGVLREDPSGSGLFVPNTTVTTADDDED